jgi:hypothetical protein
VVVMLEVLRDKLFHPHRLKVEKEGVETSLKKQEADERKVLGQSTGGSDLRRVEAKITSVQKLNLGVTAKRAAIQELEAELAALSARAARKRSPGPREAPQLLAQLLERAKSFEKLLEAILTCGKATRDERRLISDATLNLIKGGTI